MTPVLYYESNCGTSIGTMSHTDDSSIGTFSHTDDSNIGTMSHTDDSALVL